MKPSGNAGETVLLAPRQTQEMPSEQARSGFGDLDLKDSGFKDSGLNDAGFDEEAVMNAIVASALAREAEKLQTTTPHPLTLIALFCGIGLVAALILVIAGCDLGTGFF